MLEPLKLCDEEDRFGRVYYVVDPSVMYPAVIARMKEVQDGDPPGEVVDDKHPMALANYRRRIKQVPAEGLDLALVPRDEVPDDKLAIRAHALAIAWKFYRAALRAAGAKTNGTNKTISVHLINERAGDGLSDYRQ